MSTLPSGGVAPVGVLAAGPMSGVAPAGTPAATPAGAVSGSRSSISAAQAKQIGVAFEQMLVNELAQQLASTASSSGDGGSDGASTGGSTGSSSGLMGSDPASTAYAQMIPDALTSSIMSTGGIGIAQEIAASLDPALSQPQSSSASAGAKR